MFHVRCDIGACALQNWSESLSIGTTEWKEEDPVPRQGYIASSPQDLYTNIEESSICALLFTIDGVRKAVPFTVCPYSDADSDKFKEYFLPYANDKFL